MFDETGDIAICRKGSAYPFTSAPWDKIADRDGNTFSSAQEAMAYLQGQLAMSRPVGSPARSYALQAIDGQTVFPISPAPVDMNSIVLTVNACAFRPPAIKVSAYSVTWDGPFVIEAADEIFVSYF
jgi:hypothetical protein